MIREGKIIHKSHTSSHDDDDVDGRHHDALAMPVAAPYCCAEVEGMVHKRK